jgi:VWFA-related protein
MGTRREPRFPWSRSHWVLAALLVPLTAFWAACQVARGGQAESASAATSIRSQPEIVTRKAQPPFKFQAERNLVIVRVIVRDPKGHVVANLARNDFRIFDDGKLQRIVQFSVVRPAAQSATGRTGQEEPTAQPETKLAGWRPSRFLALYFDDVHMDEGNIMRVRAAVGRYLSAALKPGDRVGLFTASGQDSVDFTEDPSRIQKAMAGLMPRPIVPVQNDPCPRIYQYQAYRIINERDPEALQEATEETLICRYNDDQRFLTQAANDAQTAALTVLNNGQTQAEYSLRGLDDLVRRMSLLPGQRTLVLISPGFLTRTMRFRVDGIVNRALRSDVTINTLDSRGLATESPFDNVSQRTIIIPNRPDLMVDKALIKIDEFAYKDEVMRDLAQDTGGTYFHNNNDLAEGLREVSSLAPSYYVLAFSPSELNPNGSFHTLKVSLSNHKDLLVQARRGYFAPRQQQKAGQSAKSEIRQAVFSQDEIQQLPIEVHTQFFKDGEMSAHLAVLTHLDMRPLSFEQRDGRNWNNLAFVTAVFDRNGRCVAAKEKLVKMRLLNTTLDQLRRAGITVRSTFSIPPGSYLVRQVVRDDEGGEIAGVSRTIQIPY